MSKQSVENFLQTVKFLGKVGKFVGCNILDEDFLVFNPKAIFYFFDFLFNTSIIFYDFVKHFDDLERLVLCVVAYGFGIQVESIS